MSRRSISNGDRAALIPLVARVLGLCVACCAAVSAQVSDAGDVEPAFEVASVRPSTGTDSGWSYFTRGERWVFSNVPLQRIIALAYGIPFQLEPFAFAGDVSDVLDRRFDIEATIPPDVEPEQLFAMLRSLLAERFGLRARREVRQGPIYALEVARPGALGPELRRSEHNCREYRAGWLESQTAIAEVVPPHDTRNRSLCLPDSDDERPPPGVRQIRNAGTIPDLIEIVQTFLDRPLLDATGLSGNFEWQLTFASRVIPGPGGNSPDVPSIFVAMRDQLGLILERRTGPIELLVIESVGMPTPN